jgi:hypothetical protein
MSLFFENDLSAGMAIPAKLRQAKPSAAVSHQQYVRCAGNANVNGGGGDYEELLEERV